MTNVMGYSEVLKYGAKGSQAATEVLNATDVTYDSAVTTGSTTSRGDGTSVPVETGEATQIKGSLSFGMIVDDGDATLTSLISAAKTGLAVALFFKTFDCDCIISFSDGAPLDGEETLQFQVERVSKSDRDPIL